MFRKKSALLSAAIVAAVAAEAVQATTWVADFTSVSPESWTGSDETAVANYADTTGGNANSFTVVGMTNVGALPDGWLTQGTRGGVGTTAKFSNAADGIAARARFTTPLPGSMDAAGGVSFGWTARYGSYAMGRAPIQLAVTDIGVTGGVEYTVYLNVQNGTTLRVQSNGGSFYSNIDPLTIPNAGDGQYHQWSCAVITDGTWAHWKLWLDGSLLLFTGVDGAHQFDPGTGLEQFSFQTATNDFSGNAYIGLGDLHNVPYPDIWDFEFDCVAYKDDGLEMLTCGVAPSCDSSVSPSPGTGSSTAMRGSAADPPSHAYTITNSGTNDWVDNVNEYTAEEVVQIASATADLYSTGAGLGDQVFDPHWTIIEGGLDGTCTALAPCPAYTVLDDDFPIPPWLANDAGSRWLTVSPSDGDAIAPVGDHVFRTTFTVSATEAPKAILHGRYTMDDYLQDVLLNGVSLGISNQSANFNAWNEFFVDHGFQAGTNTLDFKVRNGGTAASPMGLRVEFLEIYYLEPGDVTWLSLDKTGGPVAAGSNDTITASIVNTDLPGGTYTGYVRFTDGCTPATQHLRQIDLIVIDCRSAVSPATNTGRSFRIGSAQTPAPMSYTFENTGASSVSYTVASSASWLVLDKPSGTIGPILPGGADTVTGTINTTGLAAGGHVATLTFTDTCNPAVQHIRQVLLSVDAAGGEVEALQQFKAEFATFTGTDADAQSPLEACDPNGTTDRGFSVVQTSDYANLAPGWLTQGSISGTPTTAKFNNPDDGLTGRARFRTFLPFDSSFDPVKGMAVAWNMRIGTDHNQRGPIQITFPRVSGPFGIDDITSSVEGQVFNAYIRVNDTTVRILNNGGGEIGTIAEAALPGIAGQYHQWSAAACYNAGDQMAYWNLWLDGEKLMFGGTNGSVEGPGGGVFSFRTSLNPVTGDPYIGLGDLNAGEEVWDFEFDWVRMLTYNVSGCPFWDGGGSCAVTVPWPDADNDGDVDQADFAAIQECYTGVGGTATESCRRFNRDADSDNDVDETDLDAFEDCATGPGVWLDPANPPAGCEL